MDQSPSTAWEVITAAAAGSAAARDEFAHRYGAFIREQLSTRWRRNALLPQVDDAQQEVFVECLKPGGVLARADRTAPEGFRALLGAVVRNVALRVEERHQRRNQREAQMPVSQVAVDATTVGRTIDRQWAVDLLRAAAAEQARRAASTGDGAVRRVELLRLRFEDGRSIAEIAVQWGLEPDYLHHQYAKARRDFQRALLTVLATRCPGASAEQLHEQAQQLVQLLRPH